MTLAFSQKINNKDTFFVEKITKSLVPLLGTELDDYIKPCADFFTKGEIGKWTRRVLDSRTKRHTIREDSKDRWKPGNDIHFVINNRTKDRFQFAPVVKCLSVQNIKIRWSGGEINTVEIWIDNECYVQNYNVGYNWSIQRQSRMEILAENDGFNSVQDFLNYFNTDFTGKIIHWTNYKY